jgi:large subunit ribosomal protein L7/L12
VIITPKTFPDILRSWGVLDIKEAIDLIGSELGIKAAAPAEVQRHVIIDSEPVDEPTEFVVTLEEVGDTKLEVIKVVRAITGLGLRESKELVDSATKAPIVIPKIVPRDEADSMATKLGSAGAKTSIGVNSTPGER